MEELESSISEVVLKPSTGGLFEVTVDGELVSSKRATGKHTDLEQIVAAVRAQT